MPPPVSSSAHDAAPGADAFQYFACGGCGKTLKTRPHLVGRRVQCPHCGHTMRAPHAGPTASVWKAVLPGAILTVILFATFTLKLHNLDHTGLTRWDEVHHAVVAQNVFKHPLEPTLVDVPYLPYDPEKWGENHVWLHKPILPFWQIAVSFALFGVNAFALRLPAAVLSTAAAGLTYLIGKELFDRPTALIAATLQAANPFILTLVQGYQFADNIDVALLFWVEVGMYFLVRALRTGSWRDVLLAGLAQGLAYLCKSYLAGIIFGVALAGWLLPVLGLARREDCRIGPARLLGMIAVTLATIAPWFVWCAVAYPDEFWHEQAQIVRHLYSDVERWAAPWDRVAFDYLIAIYGVFYTPILVAGVALVPAALARRHAGLWLVYAWGLGVILPHLFAVTKTPSGTVLAIPALLLLFAGLVTAAWRGERWPLAALTAVLVMSVVVPAVVRNPGHGFPPGRAFGGVMRRAMWVVWHVTGALAGAAMVTLTWTLIRRRLGTAAGVLGRVGYVAAWVFCLGALAWLGTRSLQAAWRATLANVNDPSSVEIGAFARENLPANAVLFCDESEPDERLSVMFYADRTCYALDRVTFNANTRHVIEAGGIPYLVSHRRLALPPVYVSRTGGPAVYRVAPP
jgi:4-amino-4-deoxy-L-arabinose transferase-like glycosyltransferase